MLRESYPHFGMYRPSDMPVSFRLTAHAEGSMRVCSMVLRVSQGMPCTIGSICRISFCIGWNGNKLTPTILSLYPVGCSALRFRLIGFAHMFLCVDDPEHDEALGKSITFRILFLNLRRQRFRTAGQHIPGTS